MHVEVGSVLGDGFCDRIWHDAVFVFFFIPVFGRVIFLIRLITFILVFDVFLCTWFFRCDLYLVVTYRMYNCWMLGFLHCNLGCGSVLLKFFTIWQDVGQSHLPIVAVAKLNSCASWWYYFLGGIVELRRRWRFQSWISPIHIFVTKVSPIWRIGGQKAS